MTKFIGEIEDKQIQQKISPKTNQQYTRAVFKIGDKVFGTFDNALIDNFTIGDWVEVETKQEGKYENLVSMVKAEKPRGNGNGKEYHLSVEECRCRAMEIAIKYYQLCEIKPERAEEFEAVSKKFFSYIYNGNGDNKE